MAPKHSAGVPPNEKAVMSVEKTRVLDKLRSGVSLNCWCEFNVDESTICTKHGVFKQKHRPMRLRVDRRMNT